MDPDHLIVNDVESNCDLRHYDDAEDDSRLKGECSAEVSDALSPDKPRNDLFTGRTQGAEEGTRSAESKDQSKRPVEIGNRRMLKRQLTFNLWALIYSIHWGLSQ